tara:strand:+ start:637 stop:801 length:165 start_codon:yes stop_codon:yes gene_type:complete
MIDVKDAEDRSGRLGTGLDYLIYTADYELFLWLKRVLLLDMFSHWVGGPLRAKI